MSTTLTVALPPGSVPTSTFPFYTGAQCTTTNIDYWDLTARPGYWFGLGSGVSVEYGISPLAVPKYKIVGANTVATVGIRGWLWSNAKGQKIKMTAADVLFWLNMDKAQNKGGSNGAACGYAPGFGVPDQVLAVTAPKGLNGNVVTLTFAGHPSDLWLTYNELSQIVPMTSAWDVVGGHKMNCAGEKWAAVSDGGKDPCTKVFTYLSSLKINNPLWSWADGPYRQASAGYSGGQPDGNDVQVANKFYSGPVKATGAQKVVYVPFTSTTAEIAQLQANKLDFGFADPADVGPSPGPGKAGPNLLPKMGGYKTVGTLTFGVFYWQFNYDNSSSTYKTTGPEPAWAAMNNNLYFRQALQSSIDQAGVIAHVDNGYSTQSWSAIPTYPVNNNNKGVTNPYPFNEAHAKAIMQAHGWNTSTSPATCAQSNCGDASDPIPSGTKAEETLVVPGGDVPVQTATQDELNTILAGADIKLDVTYPPATQVASTCFGGTSPWEICGYGGWIYAPDYYPSGEVLFAAGASSNSGAYQSAEMNQLIAETTTNGNLALNAPDPTFHTSFAEFTASDLPFSWQPTPAGFIEQAKSLKGALPPSPLTNFNPEYIKAI